MAKQYIAQGFPFSSIGTNLLWPEQELDDLYRSSLIPVQYI